MGKAKVKPSNREQRRRALQREKQLKQGRIFGKSVDRIFSDDIPNAAHALASQAMAVASAFEDTAERMTMLVPMIVVPNPKWEEWKLEQLARTSQPRILVLNGERLDRGREVRMAQAHGLTLEEWLDDGT